MVTWHKGRMGMGYRTRRTSEHLVVLQKAPRRARGVWTRHDIPDVWTERASGSHAHAKPVRLQEALIRAVTKPGDVVLDPAAGGYSVLAAAEAVGGTSSDATSFRRSGCCRARTRRTRAAAGPVAIRCERTAERRRERCVTVPAKFKDLVHCVVGEFGEVPYRPGDALLHDALWRADAGAFRKLGQSITGAGLGEARRRFRPPAGSRRRWTRPSAERSARTSAAGWDC